MVITVTEIQVAGSSSNWDFGIFGNWAATTGMPTATPSWTQLPVWTTLGETVDITGDMNTYGTVYQALNAHGFIYYG